MDVTEIQMALAEVRAEITRVNLTAGATIFNPAATSGLDAVMKQLDPVSAPLVKIDWDRPVETMQGQNANLFGRDGKDYVCMVGPYTRVFDEYGRWVFGGSTALRNKGEAK